MRENRFFTSKRKGEKKYAILTRSESRDMLVFMRKKPYNFVYTPRRNLDKKSV